MLFLKPALKETIWGGNRLRNDFKMQTDLKNIAEAWVLSCHEDGESTVIGGEFDGKSLSHVLAKEIGMASLGTNCEGYDKIEDFPILIKLIDADDKLSVQVHPDDEYAAANEKDVRGKTEAWYIIDCDENAELIYGFNDDLTKEEFRASIESGNLLDKVNRTNVKPGDVAFISAGTLHAIGKGILLAEVQQSCNTTYRVFDYNRTGLDGKPRELHVDKAVDVTNCTIPDSTLDPIGMPVKHDGYTTTLLSECPYFTMTCVDVDTLYADEADEKSFVSLVILDGEGTIKCGDDERSFVKGDSIFIPADSGSFYVSGKAKILHTKV
ncbi:MAG: class I mannose-6-phosphate isomerase [Clostridia bacterium]|nr:class I mannose-6-phosphate isomerase [Clostridia bacterium]